MTGAASAAVRSLTLSVLIVLAGCLGMGVASAQIGVGIDNPVAGGTALLTFEIPGTRAPTTRVTVRLPNVRSARCLMVSGWTCRVRSDIATGVVRAVTWTAAPGAGIGPGQSAAFSGRGGAARRDAGRVSGYPDLERQHTYPLGPATAARCETAVSRTDHDPRAATGGTSIPDRPEVRAGEPAVNCRAKSSPCTARRACSPASAGGDRRLCGRSRLGVDPNATVMTSSAPPDVPLRQVRWFRSFSNRADGSVIRCGRRSSGDRR